LYINFVVQTFKAQKLKILSTINMKYHLIFMLLFSGLKGEYVPGTPGGEWTLEELLKVRAKLWRIFADDEARNIYLATPNIRQETGFPTGDDNEKPGLEHFAAKLLRLSFHDCLRYADKTGGCDGCLNWKGMEERFTERTKFKFKYPDITEGNNNGLEYTVALMELLYTDKSYPPRTPILSESLKSSGKSRADLWAYAAKVAVEFSIEQNNFQCDNNPTNWDGSYVGKTIDCHRSMSEPNCKVVLPREIKFQYGRKDCVSGDLEKPYKAVKEEVHPNPEGNGTDTINFLKSQFDFNGRETVAILGGHTLGKMHPIFSLLKYTWTSRGGHMFNNAYYRNIVSKDDWFIEASDNGKCNHIGDAKGNLPDTKWVPTMNGFTESGGPMHWIKMHFACPNCYNKMSSSSKSAEFERCCEGKPKDLMCKPDNATRNDVDDIQGCEEYRFAFGLDEMTINAEIGLYFDFEQKNGIPTDCSGLTDFKMENWKTGKNRKKYRRAYHHNCPLNMMREPAEDDPLSTIFETYADDQEAWVKDFVPAFEKMMSNGYSQSDLQDAPTSWEGVRCWKQNPKRYKIDCLVQ
jgi:hypothetical protein